MLMHGCSSLLYVMAGYVWRVLSMPGEVHIWHVTLELSAYFTLLNTDEMQYDEDPTYPSVVGTNMNRIHFNLQILYKFPKHIDQYSFK